jgi:hypothetical protein
VKEALEESPEIAQVITTRMGGPAAIEKEGER